MAEKNAWKTKREVEEWNTEEDVDLSDGWRREEQLRVMRFQGGGWD